MQLDPTAVPKGRHLKTPLEIAIERGNHGLVLLLLCNGYDPNFDRRSALERAVEGRDWPIVDLLWAWGADPRRVYAYDILESYNAALIERFYQAGADLTENHEMAAILGMGTSNRPLYGFARRHREHDRKIQRELNMALVHQVDRENTRGVALCLWAGADPHAPVRIHGFESTGDDEDAESDEDRFEGWSAIHQAASRGRVELLKRLGPDPARDDFESIYQWASSGGAVECLAAISPPKDIGAILRNQLFYLDCSMPLHQNPLGVLREIFRSGARWTDASTEEVADIRRRILKASDSEFVDVMKLLALNEHCSATILHELTRTPMMRERMRNVGLIPWEEPDRRRYGSDFRPTHARDVARNCGLIAPKAARPVPLVVEVRPAKASANRLSIDRETLYQRVWSEPVDRLAKSWGLSGRGLGKLCARMLVPVPPRGYWARIQNGQRVSRPPLPELPGAKGARKDGAPLAPP